MVHLCGQIKQTRTMEFQKRDALYLVLCNEGQDGACPVTTSWDGRVKLNEEEW